MQPGGAGFPCYAVEYRQNDNDADPVSGKRAHLILLLFLSPPLSAGCSLKRIKQINARGKGTEAGSPKPFPWATATHPGKRTVVAPRFSRPLDFLRSLFEVR